MPAQTPPDFVARFTLPTVAKTPHAATRCAHRIRHAARTGGHRIAWMRRRSYAAARHPILLHAYRTMATAARVTSTRAVTTTAVARSFARPMTSAAWKYGTRFAVIWLRNSALESARKLDCVPVKEPASRPMVTAAVKMSTAATPSARSIPPAALRPGMPGARHWPKTSVHAQKTRDRRAPSHRKATAVTATPLPAVKMMLAAAPSVKSTPSVATPFGMASVPNWRSSFAIAQAAATAISSISIPPSVGSIPLNRTRPATRVPSRGNCYSASRHRRPPPPTAAGAFANPS